MTPKEREKEKTKVKVKTVKAQATVTSLVTTVARKATRLQTAGTRKGIITRAIKRATIRAIDMYRGWKMGNRWKRVLSPRRKPM